jgi:hypothetical protein
MSYLRKYTIYITLLLGFIGVSQLVFSIISPLDVSAAGPCVVSDNNSKTSENKPESYTYYPNCFSGTGVKLTKGKYEEYHGKGSTYWYKFSWGTGGDGKDYANLRQYTDEPNANSKAKNTWSAGSGFTLYSKKEYTEASTDKKSESAGNTKMVDALAQAVPSDIKSAFTTKLCKNETGSDKSLCLRGGDAAWKEALAACDTQANTAIARMQTGSATQAAIDKSYKDNFASCLATKTGLSKNDIAKKLPDNLLQIRSTAEKEGEDSVPKPGEDSTEEEESSCGVDGIGWFVCPSMGFVGGLMDTMFDFIAGNFLEVDSSTISDNTTRTAWGYMRNIANIAFVIAFLVIIYSQMTGMGIGNYGVKRLLPRVIITAILVNISFFIGQLAVDISNLLGYSLKSMFDGITSSLSSGFSGAGWAITIAAVLIAGVGIALAFSLPVLLAALLAMFMIILILVLRKALILLLIVVSPLAFVAFLLPNTEQWFKKWYKMFFSLLIVFPVISVVFGVSLLAANIVQGSSDDVMVKITALGISIIPLFVVPTLLKGSMNAAGSIGTKLSGVSGKATARIGKKAMTQSRLGDVTRNMKYKSAVRQANRRAGNGLTARTGRKLGDSDNKLISGLGKSAAFLGGGGMNALDNSRLGSALGLGAGADSAQVMVDEMFEKDVKAAGLTQNSMTMAQKRDIARGVTKGTTKAQRAAAMDSVMANGGFSDRREMLEHVAAGGDQDMKARAVRAAYAKGDANIYGKQFGDNILSGNITGAESLAASAVNNAGSGDLQAEHLVQSGSATEYISNSIYDAANGGNSKVSTAQASKADGNFVSAAKQARASEHTRTKIDGKIDSTFKGHGVN